MVSHPFSPTHCSICRIRRRPIPWPRQASSTTNPSISAARSTRTIERSDVNGALIRLPDLRQAPLHLLQRRGIAQLRGEFGDASGIFYACQPDGDLSVAHSLPPTRVERLAHLVDRGADDPDLPQAIGAQSQAVGQVQVIFAAQEWRVRIIGSWIKAHHRSSHRV